MDEVARRNQAFWEAEVAQGTGYTRPWLDLKRETVQAYVSGAIEAMPEPYAYIYPRSVFENVAGKQVLCLATGGGQQSAVFGLLGADVTVFDLTEGQLAGDRLAVAHHGYPVRTVQGDMRDLSVLADASFDLVYQEISLGYVPNPSEVYRGVARVLRPGGVYRVSHCNPAAHSVEESSWDGSGYRIGRPYRGGRVEDAAQGSVNFDHLLPDIFNGLAAAGLAIESVWEDPRHIHHRADAEPGTYNHMLTYVQAYFAIVTRKG
ncbi:MAG: class I SAM-dependent methyltransferase [Anaerolineae bacterium]